MLPNNLQLWRVRLTTFAMWSLVAVSVVFWTLRWPLDATVNKTSAATSKAPSIDSTAIARLLGTNASVTAANASDAVSGASRRFKLLGVVAQGQNSGSALIEVDGAAAKPYRVGQTVTDDIFLRSVKARSVTLATGPADAAAIVLELPPVVAAP